MSNRVTVSSDGMELTIKSSRGQQATLRSARPDGFSAEDIENAHSFRLNSKMVDGQVNRARLVSVCGRKFYVHVNTGPPTWWWPRIEFGHSKVMVGWFRLLVAVSFERRPRAVEDVPGPLGVVGSADSPPESGERE